jgi:translation initiation factor IF-2
MLKVVGGKSAKLLPIIIKADVNGSIEAIANTLTKLNTEEVEIDIVHSATGAINETDLNLASVSNALIVGFNVRASNSMVELAKNKDIEIRYYSIIYNIVDDMKRILSGLLDPIIKEEITGHAEIRQVFKVTGVGNVAGSFVIDGELSRANKVRLVRDGIVIHTGEISALKRFKDDVKEVKTGFECGISINNYNDIKEKDVIEGFRVVEEKREL